MNGIGFENMKAFKQKQMLDFAKITLLTGTNNSGKSTAINAAQLLKENFKHLETVFNDKESLGLDEIMNTTLSIGQLAEKFGNLEMFVNNGSDYKGFDISLKAPMRFSNAEMEIILSIELNSNTAIFGTIKAVEIYAEKQKVIEIRKVNTPNKFYVHINYKYFVSHYYNWLSKMRTNNEQETRLRDMIYQNVDVEILTVTDFDKVAFEKEIKNTNESFGTKFYLKYEPETYRFLGEGPYFLKDNNKELQSFKSLHNEIRNKIDYKNSNKPDELFYFQNLWENNQEQKAIVDEMLFNFYNKDIVDCYKLFNDDLIIFLTYIDWGKNDDNEINEVNPKKSSIQEKVSNFGFKRFIELYTNFYRFDFFLLFLESDDDIESFVENLSYIEVVEIQENQLKVSIKNNPNFFNEILKPILNLLLKKTNENIKSILKKQIALGVNYFPTSVEKFIDKMVQTNLLEVKKSIEELTTSNIISTTRIPRKRVYSFSENSEFVNQIKKLENLNEKYKLIANKFINFWLQNFNIADSFVIKPDDNTDNFKPYIIKGNVETLLADYGFGTLQILPLLLSFIPSTKETELITYEVDGNFKFKYSEEIKYKKRTLFIEEPEANLHPALQSKLADLFVDAANTFNIQIIVETHSEYLIRKLQYLTAKGIAKPEDSVIHYFYPANHPAVLSGEVQQVEKIEIDEEGYLSKEFGTGFFDEAQKIAISLFGLKQSQKN